MSDVSSNEFPQRPGGAPDHPYYHLSELSPEEVERFDRRMRLAADFFYSLAKLYRIQEYRLSHLDEIEQPHDTLFPSMKSAREEALDIGEVTPEKVLGWFQEWKADEIKRAKAFLEKETAKGSTWDGGKRSFTAAENVTFEDAFLYGSFYIEQMRLGRNVTDRYSEKFPQVVDLMKQALEIQPKKLRGVPELSSPAVPTVIPVVATKKGRIALF